MTYTVELDDDCRIQLPADLRESLHLAPGSRLKLEPAGESGRLVVSAPVSSAKEPHIVWEDGLPVIEGGSPDFDIVNEIRWMRAERAARVAGPGYKLEDFLDPAEETNSQQ